MAFLKPAVVEGFADGLERNKKQRAATHVISDAKGPWASPSPTNHLRSPEPNERE